ncbi:tyrosine-type recombinase/integrase [Bacillus tropicus]|uniref:tyrosine-type recombinase/integrase n=1 Tax=Bacillus TaxID=1386 RepID=UPI001120FD16|nr:MULTISPECIES: tyrosine-type recombinase/integrase [Bacillus]MDK3015162.1 tyrosine-type recombinase/integrase [Bacillus sp. RB3]MDM5370302.1 tyrosine-type recombinase/integrase [Bacillus bombysepticus]
MHGKKREILLQAGLRISEVVSLDIEDIDLKRRTITVISGKGGKNRIALMNLELWA